jgi:hypothetical protein
MRFRQVATESQLFSLLHVISTGSVNNPAPLTATLDLDREQHSQPALFTGTRHLDR